MDLSKLNCADYLIISPEMFLKSNLIFNPFYPLCNFEKITKQQKRFKIIILKSTLKLDIDTRYFDFFSKSKDILIEKDETKIIEKLINSNKNVHIFVIVPHTIDAEKRFKEKIYKSYNVKIVGIKNNQLGIFNCNNQTSNNGLRNKQNPNNRLNNKQNSNSENNINSFKFKIFTGKFKLNKTLLKYVKVDENSKVYNSKGERITLVKKLGSGGEGTVYLGSNQKAIKIINKPEKLTVSYKEKIEFMAKNNISIKSPYRYSKNICWPQDVIYDSSNNFLGYSMECVNSITLYDLVMQIETDKSSYGIFNLTKIEIVNIIIRILEMFSYLHSMNVIVGDIKMENIVFRLNERGIPDINQIYFVDVDSYQIDKFPATAVSQGFIAPEFKSDEYRTLAEDNFAIFTLIFMILFKGIKPYNQIKNEGNNTTYEDDVHNGRFPYSNNEKATLNKIPPGYPKYCWSHLPKYIRNAFISVGWLQGYNFEPQKRLSSSKWLYLFKIYKNHLTNGTLAKLDPYYNIGIYELKSSSNYYIKFDTLNIKKNNNINSITY